MVHVTIVGAGIYGSRIAEKYKRFNNVKIRAVISHSKPKSEVFLGIPFKKSATGWANNFGTPDQNDVFDICVHQNILIRILNEFVNIGAKNFILPKPIALNKKELDSIQKLISQYDLKVVVASQWHYSELVKRVGEFLKKNKNRVSQVDMVFSRPFNSARKNIYNSKTAFLPHIIQILQDLKLIRDNSHPIIGCVSDEKIKIRYSENKIIQAESSIAAGKEEILRVFLDGNKKPSLVADFSGVFDAKGFISFPRLIIVDRETEIKQDILETMIEKNIRYFENPSLKFNILTLDKYLPVAKQIIRIADNSKQVVGIIGGGVFGILTALEVAKKGYSVIVFEKEKEIITGASLVNHGRVHMGYHYPRDKQTVIQSLKAKTPFENFFGKSVVKKINNHYMVAKEGSMTNHNNFLSFCNKMSLPYKMSWPSGLKISKEKIAISVKVPETILDANRMKDFLLKETSQTKNITLLTNSPVVGLEKSKNEFLVNYEPDGKKEVTACAALVNATYGSINYINKLLGLPLQKFQYELCELPVASSVPWEDTGWMIMDGPFFSAMPFGYSGNHLFYDVELSVLERSIGKLPNFKFGIDYYDTAERRAERFNKYRERWKPWIGQINNCKHLYSMYTTRIVLPKSEKTDTRPTIIKELLPGFWQIFSGKITTSVPEAIEIGNKINKFLKRKD